MLLKDLRNALRRSAGIQGVQFVYVMRSCQSCVMMTSQIVVDCLPLWNGCLPLALIPQLVVKSWTVGVISPNVGSTMLYGSIWLYVWNVNILIMWGWIIQLHVARGALIVLVPRVLCFGVRRLSELSELQRNLVFGPKWTACAAQWPRDIPRVAPAHVQQVLWVLTFCEAFIRCGGAKCRDGRNPTHQLIGGVSLRSKRRLENSKIHF